MSRRAKVLLFILCNSVALVMIWQFSEHHYERRLLRRILPPDGTVAPPIQSPTTTLRTPEPTNRKYIVYVCTNGCGGLGDRFKGMTNAYMWALVTGRVLAFRLEVPCPYFLKDMLLPNKVNWNISAPISNDTHEVNYLNNQGSCSDIEKGSLEEDYPHKVINYQSNIHCWTSFAKVEKYKLILHQHGFKDFSSPGLFKKAFEDLFLWSPKLPLLVNMMPNLGITGATVSSLVCAQVRIGRSETLPNDMPRRKIESVDKQFDFVSTLRNTTTYAKIFVTTDSNKVRTLARARFGQDLVESSGSPTHIDRSDAKVACDGMTKVLLDFYVMVKECSHLQVSRSGFGILATYLFCDKRRVSMIYKDGIINGDISADFLNMGGYADYR